MVEKWSKNFFSMINSFNISFFFFSFFLIINLKIYDCFNNLFHFFFLALCFQPHVHSYSISRIIYEKLNDFVQLQFLKSNIKIELR